MVNSGHHDDDGYDLTDPDSEPESDVDSDFDSLSPADGYFRASSLPQDQFVENSSVSAEAEAKAREAAAEQRQRVRQEGSSSNTVPLPASHIDSTASSPGSVTYTEAETMGVRTPFAQDNSTDTEAPPPNYEAATAGRPSNGVFGNGSDVQVSHPPTNTQYAQPQSMSDSTQRTEPDEETALLGTSPYKHKTPLWRRCFCQPMSTCSSILVLAIVILIVIVAGTMDDSKETSGGGGGGDGDGRNGDGGKGHLPPTAPLPPPVHSSCAYDHYSDDLIFDFGDIRNFSFVELIESSNYFSGGLEGQVQIRPGPQDQDVDLKLYISYATTSPWHVQSSNYIKTDDSFELKLPTLQRVAHGSNDQTCMAIYARIELRAGVKFDNWEVVTGNLDIRIEDGLFSPQEEQLSALSISGYALLNAVRGNLHAQYWSARQTVIEMVSGSISGSFALRDLLSLKTQSGSIGVDVDPKKADSEAVVPAQFTTESHSGSVKVHFPNTGDRIPSREYRTRVETWSSSVPGTFILGAETSIHTTSGSVTVDLVPHYNSLEPSKLHVETQSGTERVTILSPVSWPGEDFSKLRSEHKYTSASGSLHLVYPQEWEGTIEGQTISGSISLKGRDVEILSKGKLGSVFEHIIAHKGTGKGKVVFKTSSASVHARMGDL